MTDDQRPINPDFVMIDLAEALMRIFNVIAAAPPELTNNQEVAMAMAFGGSAWQQYQNYLLQQGDPAAS